MPSGRGQERPAPSARFRYSLAVVCPIPRLAAIFRVVSPADFKRRTSPTLRIGNRLIPGSPLSFKEREDTPLHDRSSRASQPEPG
jgi:hypothetical protein